MWTSQDTTALKSIFELVWDWWNTPFQALGYSISWWQLLMSVFAIWIVFKLARGIFEL